MIKKALVVVRELQKVIPIARAQMRLKFVLPGKDAKRIKERLKQYVATVEKEEWEDTFTMVW